MRKKIFIITVRKPHSLLSFCSIRGMLATDPCEGITIERPSRSDGEPGIIIPSKEAIKKLLDTAQAWDITGRSSLSAARYGFPQPPYFGGAGYA